MERHWDFNGSRSNYCSQPHLEQVNRPIQSSCATATHAPVLTTQGIITIKAYCAHTHINSPIQKNNNSNNTAGNEESQRPGHRITELCAGRTVYVSAWNGVLWNVSLRGLRFICFSSVHAWTFVQFVCLHDFSKLQKCKYNIFELFLLIVLCMKT